MEWCKRERIHGMVLKGEGSMEWSKRRINRIVLKAEGSME
jgi:hypothetical protein